MKYIVFDKNEHIWQMIYCVSDNDNEELLKDIGKAMLCGNDFKKFHIEEHYSVNENKIKNDTNIFILSENGVRYLWQLGSKVSDMNGTIIPNLYYVRKIGVIV